MSGMGVQRPNAQRGLQARAHHALRSASSPMVHYAWHLPEPNFEDFSVFIPKVML
ncbi:hypothetical protein Fmac_031928 [Flemingia macrophylla]|uniref:Uncharacterized protein n=1 Tax=Flemingia macrophylla TaxID=520843 RepID=A0ABD1L3E9_9FABA